jgi:hypothetical protein
MILGYFRHRFLGSLGSKTELRSNVYCIRDEGVESLQGEGERLHVMDGVKDI